MYIHTFILIVSCTLLLRHVNFTGLFLTNIYYWSTNQAGGNIRHIFFAEFTHIAHRHCGCNRLPHRPIQSSVSTTLRYPP